jgi:hypothetical protein
MAELDATVRNTKVTVFGSDYSSDESVGLNFGPDEVWAKTENGKDFELTEEEIDYFSEKLTEIEKENIDSFEQDCFEQDVRR